MLVGSFPSMEVILIGWRVHFELCKSLFLQHLYNIYKQNFQPSEGPNIYKEGEYILNYVSHYFYNISVIFINNFFQPSEGPNIYKEKM
jgi:hypothetical protein